MTANGATIKSGANVHGHQTVSTTQKRRLRKVMKADPHHAGERGAPATSAADLSEATRPAKSAVTTKATESPQSPVPSETTASASVPPPSSVKTTAPAEGKNSTAATVTQQTE